VLIAVAKTGDVQALRLALGPVLNVRAIELGGSDGEVIDFAGLAQRARQSEKLDDDASP